MRKLLLALALALPLFGQSSTTLPLELGTQLAICTAEHPCIDGSGGVSFGDPIEHRYYDGCNWCDCVGEMCSCTSMHCSAPNDTLSVTWPPPGDPVAPTPKPEPHRGLIRKLARWLW